MNLETYNYRDDCPPCQIVFELTTWVSGRTLTLPLYGFFYVFFDFLVWRMTNLTCQHVYFVIIF